MAGLVDISYVVYLNDITVYLNTREKHTHHLKQVFERLRIYLLYANPKKCHFYLNYIDFLSFVVLTEGVSIDTSRV